VKSTYAKTLNGGFSELQTLGIQQAAHMAEQPQHICHFDGSTQVPNLRAPELFSALWMANTFQRSSITTDIMLSGTIGEYGHIWGDWCLAETADIWFDFYGQAKFLSALFGLPVVHAIFAQGTVVEQRMRHLERVAHKLHGHEGFDASQILPRIQIVELHDQCTKLGIKIGDLADVTPEGKAIGSWTCPCCAERCSLRRLKGTYIVTKANDAKLPQGCWAAQRVAKWVVNDTTVAHFVYVTGLELNVYSALFLQEKINATAHFFLRDYSDPRGTITQVAQKYAGRMSLSTRFYFRPNTDDGSPKQRDLTLCEFEDLCCHRSPADLVRCMKTTPIVSEGCTLVVTA
jgi:hypothetical protein